MHHGTAMMTRSQLLGRIEALQAACSRLSLATLCEQLDELCGFARRHGFESVEGLASLLKSAAAYNGHRQIALTYLSLMRDAAQYGPSGPESSHIYLAAAALRGCR